MQTGTLSSPSPVTTPAGSALAPDAFAGCLLGSAIGDALGLPMEGLSRRRQGRLFRGPLRYRLLFGRGLCSDDTEHACMTAQALLRASGLRGEPEVAAFGADLGWRLRGWLLALPAGIGLATLRSLLRLWLGWSWRRSGVKSAGNGPAMRAPILGLYAGQDPARLATLVRASTHITHTDPRAEQGALVVATASHLAASSPGLDPVATCARLIAVLPAEATHLAGLLQAVGGSVASGEPTQDFATRMGWARGISGFMPHTVAIALHA